MSTPQQHCERQTTLQQALAFFDRNPDEILTREDICTKFSCCPRTAKSVARALMQHGVARSQLPRKTRRMRKPQRGQLPFPDCLAPAEEGAIYGMQRYGSIAAAAAAYEVLYSTIETHLKKARAKAGVTTTAALVAMYAAASAADEQPTQQGI